MKAKIVGMIVLVLLVGHLGWRIHSKLKQDSERGNARGSRGGPAAVAVETAPVTTATVRAIGKFTGSLEPRSRFVVAPKVGGRLERLTVDMGDMVHPGQLIGELDGEEYAQQAEQAKAEVAVALAALAELVSALGVARRDLVRVKSLHEKNVAPDFELDESQARCAAAEARHNVALYEVTRREAALKAAEVRLAYTRIHAEWRDDIETRVVGERYVHEGDMLTPNEPIVSILDNRIMTAAIDITEREYAGIATGQTALIDTDAFAGVEFTGTVTRISPILKELSRQARVEIQVSNPAGILKPGMFIRAHIEFARHDNAVVVPLAAIAKREGRQGVFVIDNSAGKANFVPVTLGIMNGELAEIVKPALSGTVATLGHHLLEDGSAVRLPGEQSGGKAMTASEKTGKAKSGKDFTGGKM